MNLFFKNFHKKSFYSFVYNDFFLDNLEKYTRQDIRNTLTKKEHRKRINQQGFSTAKKMFLFKIHECTVVMSNKY